MKCCFFLIKIPSHFKKREKWEIIRRYRKLSEVKGKTDRKLIFLYKCEEIGRKLREYKSLLLKFN